MRSSIGPWMSWSPYNVGVLLLLSTTKRVGLALLRAVLIFGWTPSSIDGVNAWASTNASSRLGCTFDYHDQLAARFVQGLRTFLAQMLQDPSIADRDQVYFHLASDGLRHAYDGWGLTAGEWRRDEGRMACLLENLSRMLNSNENFQMDDTFHLSFVHVRARPYGRLPAGPSILHPSESREKDRDYHPPNGRESAVPEPLSPPGPMRKITLSGDPSSEGCHSN